MVNLQRKCLDISFPAVLTDNTTSSKIHRLFKIRLQFAQMKEVVKVELSHTGQIALVFALDAPPLIYRKAEKIEDTHENGTTFWTEWQAWFRQTEISDHLNTTRHAVTQLQTEDAIIDVGRWLTYVLIFEKAVSTSDEFKEMCKALIHHNVSVKSDKDITLELSDSTSLWHWLDSPASTLSHNSGSFTSELDREMAREVLDLPFEVRYQLEVCISNGLLHECNIDKSFLAKLIGMEPVRAVKLLEKVAEEKERFWIPNDIFKRLLHKTIISSKLPPAYCALVRSATVTPTTIYFMSPVLETSNRVIRQFSNYADRFLRVRFTDEKYKGKVMSPDDNSANEVFTRIKRTMTNGIKVGDRHYEFLAFGNSQFREGGAWFFAPGGGMTPQKIRDWMGDFQDIRIIAKYCARIGLAFSTTRAFGLPVARQSIEDIVRNGYCFTDGVGKISSFLAQMIAREYSLPSSSSDYPSVIQFRLGECKGILAVDPSLPWNTVQIRPSQEKFAKPEHQKLEICRISQFTAARLNIQLILVLSALGVPDIAFLSMMKDQLKIYKEAMEDQQQARTLLVRNVDYNQMTVELAQMIDFGFMETRDPFIMSCLYLWRSWSIKYLKEKAQIFVEDGAFVLGCVDETATLRGHFNGPDDSQSDVYDIESLPQIFLQIEDPDSKGEWKVIEGVCAVARNPSLHPGDVRVVHAVNVPALHHLRNCVVLPQTGDRPLANMCSGGDLDGDDYLVMWDRDLLPREWNHPAMDYDPPDPVRSSGPVTVDNMTSFFVTHLKHANLSRIAVAHRYWADKEPDGVKSAKCLLLALLHSMAVDYCKTGVPAEMPKALRPTSWPHWAEVKNKSKSKIYQSNKIIGRLYDMVQKVNFVPAWDLPFDRRILEAYNLDDEVLSSAREVKAEYDEAVRRLMAKFSIKSEFEIWTTFALEHSDDMGDYKFAETLGQAVSALKDHHKSLCYEKAGTTEQKRDWGKMGPFIAAMYTIVAQDVEAAKEMCNKVKLKGGQWVPVMERTFENMPFTSFPWLFAKQLGEIVTKSHERRSDFSHFPAMPKRPSAKTAQHQFLEDFEELNPLPEIQLPNLPPGESEQDAVVESDATSAQDMMNAVIESQREILNGLKVSNVDDMAESEESIASTAQNSTVAPPPMAPPSLLNQDGAATSSHHSTAGEGHSEDDEVEEVTIPSDNKPSAFDQLQKLLGS